MELPDRLQVREAPSRPCSNWTFTPPPLIQWQRDKRDTFQPVGSSNNNAKLLCWVYHLFSTELSNHTPGPRRASITVSLQPLRTLGRPHKSGTLDLKIIVFYNCAFFCGDTFLTHLVHCILTFESTADTFSQVSWVKSSTAKLNI